MRGASLRGLAAAGIAALAFAGAGCYGFAGGGLPPQVRTVAILPFENLTPEATLSQEVNRSVRDAVEGRLGLRQAGEGQADALVRGSITRYEPDVPVSYTGDATGGNVEVTSRLVQITVSVEIFDQRAGRALWQRQGLLVEGQYEPGREAEGRRRALEKLVTTIVEGAQSQW